jgi:hypothetical protein
MSTDTPLSTDLVPVRHCTCVSCGECGGSGTVWFAFGGREYLGNSRCDDLDEMETCEECRGSGITEMCDYCQDTRDDYDY